MFSILEQWRFLRFQWMMFLSSSRKFSTAALSEKPILCKRCGRFRIVFILMLLRRGRNIKNPQQHLFCQEKLSAIEPPSNESNVIKCVLAVVFCSLDGLTAGVGLSRGERRENV